MINFSPLHVNAKYELIGATCRVEIFKPDFIPQILLICRVLTNPERKICILFNTRAYKQSTLSSCCICVYS